MTRDRENLRFSANAHASLSRIPLALAGLFVLYTVLFNCSQNLQSVIELITSASA